MNEPKPLASLSPSLLARKGGARPAMRSQLQPQWPTAPHFQDSAARHAEEDLGWNDMGYDRAHDVPEPAPAPAPRAAAPAPRKADVVALKPSAPLAPPKVPQPREPQVPEVVRQQSAIAERVAAERVTPERVPEVTAPRSTANPRRSALTDGRRAAFTLRLDAERHLKLRLACTIANRSAQQIVTDALDQFIAGLPEVAALAAQVKKRG